MILNLILVLLSYLFLVVGVLISVAFMVLLERKVLGYIQIRYTEANQLGVRFEPWHIRVAQG